MNKDFLEKNIKEIIIDKLNLQELDDEIIENMDLYLDAAMDSLTFISIIIEIENAFDIEIPDNLLIMDKFKNFKKICDIVEKISKEKNE